MNGHYHGEPPKAPREVEEPSGMSRRNVNGTEEKPVLKKRPPGGIVMRTVKRAPAPPPSSSTSQRKNGLLSSGHRNALSEDYRKKIEDDRRERERKKEAEEEAERRKLKQIEKARIREKKKRVVSNDVSESSEQDMRKKKMKSGGRFPNGSEDEGDVKAEGTPNPKKKTNGRSRTTESPSEGYRLLGRSGVQPHYLVPRQLDDFETFESRDSSRPIQSADLVSRGKQYGPFFHGLDEEQVCVDLEYPADGASEKFTLLVPRDPDEYDPVSDLLRAVATITGHYLTPEQRSLFGNLDSLEVASAAGSVLGMTTNSTSTSSRARSREGSTALEVPGSSIVQRSTSSPLVPFFASRDSTPTVATPLSPAKSAVLTSARDVAVSAPTTAVNSQVGTPTPDEAKIRSDSVDANGASTVAVGPVETETILRSFTKARNRRDGPLFLRTVERFNATLKALKEAGKIRQSVETWQTKGIAEGVWRCLQEQCYARTVGPHVEDLAKYEAFSDNVYGELLPRFMSEIAQLTNLGPQSVFVDLGSGVGNLVMQVALQTGAQAYGCEQMAIPNRLAQAQLQEARRRWRMWGLKGGAMDVWEGDFGEDEKIREKLRHADVVLVNNYAFTARTNDKLSLLFLDLKDGAMIVSLKPFVAPDFRLTERTLSSPLAILRVAQRAYSTNCVSWAESGGKYYIHTVDRSMISRFLDRRDADRNNVGKRK